MLINKQVLFKLVSRPQGISIKGADALCPQDDIVNRKDSPRRRAIDQLAAARCGDGGYEKPPGG